MVRKASTSKTSGKQQAVCLRGGQIEYKPEYIPKMLAFFSTELEAYAESTDPNGTVRQRSARPPTFQRFAVMLGVTRRTLYNWAHECTSEGAVKYPDFAHAYELAKDMAEAIKIEGAIMKVYDAKMVMFDLMVNHGWQVASSTPLNVKFDETELEAVYARGIATQKAIAEANRIDKMGLLDELKVIDA